MNDVRARLFAVVGLAVLGVVLAVTGSALGVSDPVTATEPSARFTVSENNITLSDGDREVTVVENLSAVKTVEIRNRDTRFSVHSEENEPLTDAERARTVEVARQNDTLRRFLSEDSDYEIDVQPVKRLNASTAETVTATVTGTEPNGSEQSVFRIETTSLDGEESVRIHRRSPYVDNRTTIRVRDPEDSDLLYSAEVDLADQRVVDITDWTDD